MIDKMPAALSIAGSDSSAGAGIQADLKTFSALGVYGATVVTAVTAQNTLGVTDVHPVPASSITAQIEAVFSDLDVRAVKTGMFATAAGVLAASDALQRFASQVPIVVDPVMISSSGRRLLEGGAERALAERLIPQASLITPNLEEAAALLGTTIARSLDAVSRQAERLLALGPKAVLVKGGHGAGPTADDLFYDGKRFRTYSAPRIATVNTHGTGCTLSAAVAASLVKGVPMEDAIASAKTYVQGALERAKGLRLGSGAGPLSHFSGG